MRHKTYWLFVSSLAIAALLLTSCAPAAPPPPASKTAPTAQLAAPTAPAAPVSTPKPSAGQAKYGGVLTLSSRLAIPHFDMHQDSTAPIQTALAPVYSMLVENDPNDENKVVGDLATSWDISGDGLSFSFRLHEGVKFHDGKALTANDVKFNLDRIVFPPKGTLSPRQALYQNVEKVEAPDGYAIRITLKRQQAAFMQLMAMPFNFIFQPDIVRAKGDMKKDVVGTGPFKLSSYTSDVSFKAQKNPDYFVKGRPYLDGVTCYIVKDDMARLAAFKTRQLLLLTPTGGATGPQTLSLKQWDPRMAVQEVIQASQIIFTPNLKVKPWDDVRVRRAVTLAIDREAAAKVIRGGDYPGYGYMVPNTPWTLPEQEVMSMPGFRQPKDQDIAEGKKLLAEAGFPEGFKLNLQSSNSSYVVEASQAMQNQLANVGITVNVQVLELATLKDRTFKGTFDVNIQSLSSAHSDPDIIFGEYYVSGSPRNEGGWSNQKFEEFYDAQSRTMDMAKRQEIVRDMQRLIHQEAPRMVVAWGRKYGVMWPEVRDYRAGTSTYYNNKMAHVWLTQ